MQTAINPGTNDSYILIFLPGAEDSEWQHGNRRESPLYRNSSQTQNVYGIPITAVDLHEASHKAHH